MYSFIFDSILSRSLRILFFISSHKSLGNGVATIVFSVKNFPKWYLHFPLLYLWQDLECECTWYVVNWKSSRSVTSFGTNAFTIESTNLTYSSIFFLCKTGTSNIHKKEWICGLPHNWNSTQMAWYLTFSRMPSKSVSPFNVEIIDISSFHLRSKQLRVMKNVRSPSCFTIASTSGRNFFHYVGVSLILFINL